MIFINGSKSVIYFYKCAQWALRWVGCGTQVLNDARASFISHKHFYIVSKRYHNIKNALASFCTQLYTLSYCGVPLAFGQNKTQDHLIYYH